MKHYPTTKGTSISYPIRSILILFSAFIILATTGCKATFIKGYDEQVDKIATEILHDFNLMFIKLQRALKTDDENKDQAYENFQDYYDELKVDILIMQTRTAHNHKKARQVAEQVDNLEKQLLLFEKMHMKGFTDGQKDDKSAEQRAFNSSVNAIIVLQKGLKELEE